MTEVLTNNNNNNEHNKHYNNVQQSFDINLDEIPLSALGTKCRKTLSILLNPTKVLLSEEGLPRDWRGVMHFSGLSHQYGPLLSNKADPLDELLKIWCNQSTTTTTTQISSVIGSNNNNYNEHQQFVDNISLAQFQRILGTIDRWDVIDDTNNFFLDDAERYLNIKLKSDIANRNQNSNNENSSVYFNPDANILTIDDAALAKQGLPPQLYDAFVLYADEDIDFATEIIEKMENYGLKLCVRERDLIGGISFEHEAILRLISDRCTRLIVVVSPSFFKSPANTFFVNFAQALGIEQRKRKIIPCQYETCLLPPTLSYFFLLNYQRSGRLYNFWEKLKDSIQSSPVELAAAINHNNSLPRITITEMDSTTISQQNNQTTRLSIMPMSKSKITNNTINNHNNNKDTMINNINTNHNNNNYNNNNKNDNRINEPTTPIAAPRKRKDKKYLSNEKLLAQKPIPQIVISLHHDDKIKAKSSTNLQIDHNNNNENKNENIDQLSNAASEKRIWPPPPKLRTTTSMWNLSSINSPIDNNNNQHLINTNSNYDISKSTISLNNTQKTNCTPPSPTHVKSDAKKPKWYKKLLLPNSPHIRIPSDSETETSTTTTNHNHNHNINIKDKEKKRKWFRKKIASLS